jgi:hypothetical protein
MTEISSTQKSLLTIANSRTSLATNLYRYLTQNGWEKQPPGPAGSLWVQTVKGLHERVALAVPDSLEPEASELAGILRRLAAFERRSAADIAINILTQYVDVTRLRAANDHVITGTIPLSAGVSLVESARSMLRAAGTTARRPRPQIKGAYSKLGDEIVEQARMAHTEDGSYVLPVWMPLTPPDDVGDTLFDEIEQRMPVETQERRVMRTLAQSLEAVQKVILQPSSAPRNTGDLLPVIAAGGSREMLLALHRILQEPAVAEFEATFDWAGGLKAPGGVPERVTLEADAAPLLKDAARLLKVPDRFPTQIYTGPIVVIMHRPGDPYGEIGIDTVRQNRSCEVRVRLDSKTLSAAYEWARDERAILVEGDVRRGGPGQKLRIDAPHRILPLDETFLPSSAEPPVSNQVRGPLNFKMRFSPGGGLEQGQQRPEDKHE